MAVALAAGSTVLGALGFLLPLYQGNLLFVPIAASFTLVGALVAVRRPEHPVGWLFLAFGCVASLDFAASQYWYYAGEVSPGALPGAPVAASVAVHTWHPAFALFILAFLHFPDGRPLSPRWRWAGRATAAAAVVMVIAGVFEYDFLRNWYLDPTPEPLFTGPLVPVADAVFSIGLLVVVAMFPGSAVSIALRYRRAGHVVRQQIKWVAFAIILVAVMLPVSVVVTETGEFAAPLLPLIPIAAGIAVLRHGLFDIDRLINRTVVYAAVTAVLAAVYGVAVFTLTRVVEPVGGGSDLAVAGSTLLAAGLFRPARRRVQAVVDRRFNRARYDATRTVERYRGRLRDELDLDAVCDELLDAARDTMQPVRLSLSLRNS